MILVICVLQRFDGRHEFRTHNNGTLLRLLTQPKLWALTRSSFRTANFISMTSLDLFAALYLSISILLVLRPTLIGTHRQIVDMFQTRGRDSNNAHAHQTAYCKLLGNGWSARKWRHGQRRRPTITFDGLMHARWVKRRALTDRHNVIVWKS